MEFDIIDFGNETLNNISNSIIKKAEELDWIVIDHMSRLPDYMESGAYLGGKFLDETLPQFNLIASTIGKSDKRVIDLGEMIVVTAITMARVTCHYTGQTH